MKTKFHLIAGVAMVAALASCSSDDLVGNPEVKLPTDMTTAYAKVNIAMKGTRASEADPKFDAGTADEAKVNSLTLVLYGDDNAVVAYGSLGAQAIQGQGSNVSDTYPTTGFNTVELTVAPGKDIDAAAKVVAYVNMNADVTSDLKTDKTIASFGDIENGGLYMTNSGYFDAEKKWVVATDIVEGSIYSSKDAAVNGPATTIYVERLAAKVSTSLKEGFADTDATADINILAVDETKVELVFKAEDAVWAPTGTAQSMYELKNKWSENLGWADPNTETEKLYRSYWAAGVNYTTAYADMQKALTYLSSNDLRGNITEGKAMKATAYTFEHTYGQDVVGDSKYNALGAATSVILLGQYKVMKNGVETNDYQKDGKTDFYLLLNSVGEKENYTIYNEKQLKKYLLDHTNGGETVYVDSKDGKVEATADNVTLDWKDKQYTIKETLYKSDAEEAEEVEVDKVAKSNARHYNEGYAYFFAPIEHLGGANAVGQYGVVRNHSYNMTINSIKSLGAPLDDDHFSTDPDPEDPDPTDPGEEPIVPDPETAAYLDAVINVLSWHVINQGVDL